MTTSNKTHSVKSHTSTIAEIKSHNIQILFGFVIVIIVFGIVTALGNAYYQPDTNHWMEGPAVAIMMLFMPLTAVSYLHFRLPKKQDELKVIKRALHFENEDSEAFSMMFSQEDSDADYLLPIFFVSFFSMLGFYILLANNGLVLFSGMDWITEAVNKDLANNHPLNLTDTASFRRGVVAIGMAFLGAYIWSIQYIFRRMMTLDLPPGAYYNIGSRMVYSSFLAVVIQHFIINGSDENHGILSNQLIAISFLVGIFPERALSWMKDSLGNIFANKSHSANPLPLEMLEGVSGFHKARLLELGIDNVQNLAQASLMELILKTPFKPRVLIDWMAQARLCLEFKEKTKEIRNVGVRTILDLQEVAKDEQLLAALVKNADIELDLIKTICQTNRNEKSIDRLREAYDRLNVI